MTPRLISTDTFGRRLRRSINGPFANVKTFSNFCPGKPLRAHGGDSRDIYDLLGASKPLSLGPRISETRFYSFNDQTPLQFGDGTQNGEYHLASRSRGVQLF